MSLTPRCARNRKPDFSIVRIEFISKDDYNLPFPLLITKSVVAFQFIQGIEDLGHFHLSIPFESQLTGSLDGEKA